MKAKFGLYQTSAMPANVATVIASLEDLGIHVLADGHATDGSGLQVVIFESYSKAHEKAGIEAKNITNAFETGNLTLDIPSWITEL